MFSNDLNTAAKHKESCRVYIEVNNNQEHDLPKNNNKKIKNSINEEEIDLSTEHQRSFPKKLGENIGWMNQIFLIHFLEYCFSIKKLIIDKIKED